MKSKKPSYSELLRDPRWQKKRLELLEKYGWKCADCGAYRQQAGAVKWEGHDV